MTEEPQDLKLARKAATKVTDVTSTANSATIRKAAPSSGLSQTVYAPPMGKTARIMVKKL